MIERFVEQFADASPLNEKKTLSQKASDNRMAWEKYVRDNNKYNEVQFQIDQSKKNVPVYDAEGNVISTLKGGDTFYITDSRIWTVEGNKRDKFAKTTLGFISLSAIQKPGAGRKNVMDAENHALKDLQKEINEIRMEEESIDLHIGKFVVPDVYGIVQPKGDPKADFCLLDQSNNYIGFISHKKKGGAKAFQQLSGISKASQLKHKEIDAFAKALKEYVDQYGIHNGLAVYRPVKDPKLMNQSVYGPDYPGKFGLDNCHCIGQGNPIIREKGGKYYLDFDEEMHVNGDVKWGTKGDYQLVFLATFRRDRNFHAPDGTTFPKVRAGIYPFAMAKTRSQLTKV